MSKFSRFFALVVLLVSQFAVSSPVLAADDGFWSEENWLIRVRGIGIVPDEDSTTTIGGSAEADNSIVPEVDFTYFFSDHVAAELILATAEHTLTAKNTTLGNLNLGDVWLLPPTLTLQYHFSPDQVFSPYVGAGLNYTVFYGEDAGSSVASLDVDNSIGYVLQAGVDYWLDDHWGLNLDVKKLYLNTDVSLNGGAITADVDLDPWIIGSGISFRF